MQICMKMALQSRRNLADAIDQRQRQLGISYSEIARRTGIHVGQVSRICRGEFKTVSASVMQICKILDVQFDVLTPRYSALENHQRRLEIGVLEIWDKTPEDAGRILRLLRQIAELRRKAIVTSI
jgi:transcriptional regulator with XRE-family HTH domain